MSFEVRVSGLKELQAQLLELGAEVGQKTLARAARRAFAPVLAAAKAKLIAKKHINTGELLNAIKMTVIRPRTGSGVVVVGLRIGKGVGFSQYKMTPSRIKSGRSAARRWHFIEF